jgi:hypothetical protein
MVSSPPSIGALDYLALWQYFQERGVETKESMLKVLTWILGFASAVLGFLIQKTVTIGGAVGFQIEHPVSVLALATAGLALCWFAVLVLRDFNTHIDSHFDAADRVLRELRSLQPFLGIDPRVGPGEYKGQRLAKRLEGVVLMFAAVFILAALGGAARLLLRIADPVGYCPPSF